MKNTITACLIVYNEEKIIRRCLESIYDIVDEIVLIHDGECTDRTLDIAKEYKAKIFIRPHNGNAEKQRPFSYKQANGDWILQIDSDEFLPNETRKEIRNLVQAKDIDAYSFRWPFFDGKKYVKGFENEPRPCLFRKSKLYFVGISHETPQTYGILKERLDLTIEHKPSFNHFTWDMVLHRWLPWNDTQAKEIIDIDKADTFNISDKNNNKLFIYYKMILNHPIKFYIRYVLGNIYYRVKKKTIFIAPLNCIKLSLYLYISVAYLLIRLEHYKKIKERFAAKE